MTPHWYSAFWGTLIIIIIIMYICSSILFLLNTSHHPPKQLVFSENYHLSSFPTYLLLSSTYVLSMLNHNLPSCILSCYLLGHSIIDNPILPFYFRWYSIFSSHIHSPFFFLFSQSSWNASFIKLMSSFFMSPFFCFPILVYPIACLVYFILPLLPFFFFFFACGLNLQS